MHWAQFKPIRIFFLFWLIFFYFLCDIFHSFLLYTFNLQLQDFFSFYVFIFFFVHFVRRKDGLLMSHRNHFAVFCTLTLSLHFYVNFHDKLNDWMMVIARVSEFLVKMQWKRFGSYLMGLPVHIQCAKKKHESYGQS